MAPTPVANPSTEDSVRPNGAYHLPNAPECCTRATPRSGRDSTSLSRPKLRRGHWSETGWAGLGTDVLRDREPHSRSNDPLDDDGPSPLGTTRWRWGSDGRKGEKQEQCCKLRQKLFRAVPAVGS